MLYRVVSWLFVKVCDLWSCFKSAFIFIHLLQCSSYVFTGSPDACRNYQCVSGIYVLQPRPGAHWTKILIEAWRLWYLFTVFYIFSTIGCVVMSLFYLALIRSQLTSTRKSTMRPCFRWSTHFWSMKSWSLCHCKYCNLSLRQTHGSSRIYLATCNGFERSLAVLPSDSHGHAERLCLSRIKASPRHTSDMEANAESMTET